MQVSNTKNTNGIQADVETALGLCEGGESACYVFLCPIPARRNFRLPIRVIRGYAFSHCLNRRPRTHRKNKALKMGARSERDLGYE